jgi:hypothetical protein
MAARIPVHLQQHNQWHDHLWVYDNECADGVDTDGTHAQYDRFSLTVDNSTINDIYEHYAYNVTDGDTSTTQYLDTYGLGNAITLDVESDIVIQNNSRIAGITLTQGIRSWIIRRMTALRVLRTAVTSLPILWS